MLRIASIISAFFIPSMSLLAVPVLTGLLQDGRQAGENGTTGGSPIFNTLGNEGSFANIYLTEPNGGHNGPLLNSGNGNAASVSYALAPGTHEFYFFTMGFWNNDPGLYGLNLFFNGDNTNPGISAYSPRGVLSANAATAGIPALALNGTSFGVTPTPADLSITIDGLVVTLTEYGFGPPGSFGVPILDRVGNLNSAPDGHMDSIGRFTLTVTAASAPLPNVPEVVNSAALLSMAVGLLVTARRKSRTPAKKPSSN